MDRCAECGHEYDLSACGGAGADCRRLASELSAVLLSGSERLGARSRPETWSPLEYACHVRDVLIVQRERVLLARWTDRPVFAPMGRDERVELDGYSGQDPRDVATQLTEAARLFANVLARLAPEEWDRTVVYGYPSRLERPLRWVAVHTVHEMRHHLLDVGRQMG